MSDTETRLRELLHETTSLTGPVPYADRIAGAHRYAVRARRVRLAAAAAVAVALIAAGGVVASGAFRDHTLAPAKPAPTTPAPSLAPGPSWKNTYQLTDTQGRKVTLSVAAVIAKPGMSTPDPRDRAKALFTTPQMGGYYTLTNDAAAPRDANAPIGVMAYWKVPQGFCTRYDQHIAEGGWPVPKVAGGQELCPLAAGNSTLPQTPQTLSPGKPLLVRIDAVTIDPDPRAPLSMSPSDAATAVRITAQPPVGWLAFDDDFAINGDGRVAGTGMPPR